MSLDELTDNEKTAEILPISVQQLYVLSQLGKSGEAEALAATLSTQEYVGYVIDMRTSLTGL